jgi:hypothetical protein
MAFNNLKNHFMNKIIMVFAVAFLASCTNRKEATQASNPETHTSHAVEDDAAELHLNNGRKWQLDDSTRENIALLDGLLEGPLTGKDPKQLGIDLQQRTNELVSECRMEGPDHDALHVWLEDYIKDLKHFREAEPDGEAAYALLREDMNKFHVYFK